MINRIKSFWKVKIDIICAYDHAYVINWENYIVDEINQIDRTGSILKEAMLSTVKAISFSM